MSDLVPEGWNFDFLPAFIEINPSFDKTLKLTDNTDVSFIKMEDVSNGAAVKNLRRRKYSEVKKGFTKFINNDVLVAKITPCFENGKGGHIKGLTNGIGFGSTEFHVFRAKENSDSSYFFHFSNYPTFRLKAEASMCGTGGQRRVQTDFFRTFKTTYPPLPEQQKIAAILSSVDEVIEKIQAQIEKLKDLKTGMMQELLSPREPKASDQAGAQTSKTNGLHHTEFKDSPLGRIPVGWDCQLLDKVAKRGSGHTPDKKKPEYWNDGIKWISLTDSSKLDQLYISNTAKSISFLGIENSSAVLHPAGTVVITRDAGIGKSAITTDVMAVSQHLIAWGCGEKLNNYFLYYILQLWKPRFEAIAMGSTIKTIGLPYFKQLKLPLPPIDEQKNIANSLKSVDLKILSLEKKNSQNIAIKKALMQDLLTGKVRVSVN